MGLTRWVNRIFRSCSSGPEFYDFGVYTPIQKVRRASNIPSSSSSSPSVASSDNSEKRQMKANEQKRVADEKAQEEAKQAAKKEMERKSKEYEEKFKTYSNGKPALTLDEAATFARAMGFAPTAHDMMNYERNNPGEITIKVFMEMMTEIGTTEDDEEELMVLFRHYDRTSRGMISKNQFVNIMTNFGEPLTREEVNILMKECDTDTDPVDYVKFVKALLN
eukprot:GHVH01000467.1.p2 GENE.GHVH01000467.1~~GHVH01000467.1.p2  ORF type:complete len:221 (+),score=40.45 GHVH01000467.1:113-775(+)